MARLLTTLRSCSILPGHSYWRRRLKADDVNLTSKGSGRELDNSRRIWPAKKGISSLWWRREGRWMTEPDKRHDRRVSALWFSHSFTGRLLVQMMRTLQRSALLNRKPMLCWMDLSYCAMSPKYRMPPDAFSSKSIGKSTKCSGRRTSTHGIFGFWNILATVSKGQPASPMSKICPLWRVACSSCLFSSLITLLLPRLLPMSTDCACVSPCLRARSTVCSSFCSGMGFSRKSNAPILVASTAVSMLPCPLIITTGMVSRPLVAHSFSRVMPSLSGIQISSKTREGRS